ncbi:MAG: phosphate/phosphite/phosphonate ABC transporter substrate-binding protein [Gammaproteobacteria bacterium]|nr:MAG: phosphate/phosphite/phosphonate ABC transporter substrate-binding protein [Gammaproteobacteria bacterium]
MNAHKPLPAARPAPLMRGVLLFCVILYCVGAPAKTLRMGIFPYFSPEQLIGLHKPLKDYLAHETGLPIRLVSAPDFKTFRQGTAAGRYDLLVTAPHLGRLAERQARYRWLAVTSNYSEAVFVARRDGPIHRIADLRGKRLALPPRLAIIHQMALETLEATGLEGGRDVTIVPYKSHDRALYAVILGETDAAAVGRPTWRRYQAPEKRSLRVIGRSRPIPGFAIMVHRDLPKETAEALRRALEAFPGTPVGKTYFDTTGLEGVRPISPQDLAVLDHYLARIEAAREAASQ